MSDEQVGERRTNSRPTFHVQCLECGSEFQVICDFDEVAMQVCPTCASEKTEQLFFELPIVGSPDICFC